MESLSNLLPVGPTDILVHRGARRQAARYPVHATVTVRSPHTSTGVVLIASAGGIRVAVDRSFEVGELLELAVTFGGDRISEERAEVVWSRSLPDGHVLGLRFVLPS